MLVKQVRVLSDPADPQLIKTWNLTMIQPCENAVYIRWLNSNGDYSYFGFSPYPITDIEGSKIGKVINSFTEQALANSRNFPIGYRHSFKKMDVIASAVPIVFRRKLQELFISPAVYMWQGDETPDENLISGWTNDSYDTFESDRTVIVEAENTGVDTQFALSDTFDVTQAERITVIFFLTLNGGVVPFAVRVASTTAVVSNSVATVEGLNVIELIITADATASIQILATDPTEFETTKIIVKRGEVELDWLLLEGVEGSHQIRKKNDNDNFECTLVLPENYTQQLGGSDL